MFKIPKLPKVKLPQGEDLQYKEKEFLLSVYEQFQRSSKRLFYIFGGVIILAFPVAFLSQLYLAGYLIKSYHPPLVNPHPYTPEEIQVLDVQVLPVVTGVYSAYAQIVNPNPDISVRRFRYEFRFKDSRGMKIKTIAGEDYLPAGMSKFLILPTVKVSDVVAAELAIREVGWTKQVPESLVAFEVLQKKSGQTPEGNFFVEGIAKNTSSFGLKNVAVPVVVFDSSNQNVLAVNSTVLSDLKPFENRYFRVLWPVIFTNIGEVRITPGFNPLDPGLILEQSEKVPSR